MPRTRNVAIVGANKEGLALLPLLERDPSVRVRLIADRNPDALVFKLDALGYQLASKYQTRVASTLDALAEEPDLDLIIDASHDTETAARLHARKPPGTTVMSALSARLLWGTKGGGPETGDAAAERQSALLTGLAEIIGAVDLTSNQEELLSLVLSVAIESTGADRGSLLLLDPDEGVLRVKVSVGIPPEIVPSIRIPIGEGIAGRVAKEGRPMRISGPADPKSASGGGAREDVAAALCVPLRAGGGAEGGAVIGVLNVHHCSDPGAFSEADLAFLTRLAALEAEIISRSQEYARLKEVAARFATYREFRERLDADGPLNERLDAVCRAAAARLPGGSCTVYRVDPDAGLLVLEGTSQPAGAALSLHGTRLPLGQGLEGAVARDRRERRLVDPDGGGSVLAAPLIARGAVQGVLVLTGTEGNDAPVVMLARELKPLLAEALREARERVAADHRATKMAAITEAGLSILAAGDPGRMARVAAASAAMVLEADIAIVRLRADGGRLPIRGAYGLPGDAAGRQQRLDVERTLAARVSRSLAPLREGNWLVHPLMVGGRFSGTLTVADKIADDPFRPGPFGPADVEVLGRLAAYVEQALRNAAAAPRPAPRPAAPSPPPASAPKAVPAAAPGSGGPDAAAVLSPAPAGPNGTPREARAGGAIVPASSGEAYLSRRLADELARSRRNGRQVAVIVARLEPEERLAGDVRALEPLITSLGELFRSVLRVYDEIVRLGPTRLAILLPDTDDGARAVAERLAAAAQSGGAGDALIGAGVRLVIGVAQAPDDLPSGPLKDRERACALIERAIRGG